MKYFLLLFTIVIAIDSQAQLTPSKNAVQDKWIKSHTDTLNWFAVRDTTKFPIGQIQTQLIAGKDSLLLISTVTFAKGGDPQIDTSIANSKDLAPVYHSSYNAQRNMTLQYGATIHANYYDKASRKKTDTTINVAEKYFDSNLYSTLLQWLPYKEGYHKDISIFNFDQNLKSGVFKVIVKDVVKGTFKTKNEGDRKVWTVTVIDESTKPSAVSVCHIDAIDRRLWKQEIMIGQRQIWIERAE